MKVWVEIPKDKSRACYVFQYRPERREFYFWKGPTGGLATYHPNLDIENQDLIQFLRDFTLERVAIDRSSESLLYEVEL